MSTISTENAVSAPKRSPEGRGVVKNVGNVSAPGDAASRGEINMDQAPGIGSVPGHILERVDLSPEAEQLFEDTTAQTAANNAEVAAKVEETAEKARTYKANAQTFHLDDAGGSELVDTVA